MTEQVTDITENALDTLKTIWDEQHHMDKVIVEAINKEFKKTHKDGFTMLDLHDEIIIPLLRVMTTTYEGMGLDFCKSMSNLKGVSAEQKQGVLEITHEMVNRDLDSVKELILAQFKL